MTVKPGGATNASSRMTSSHPGRWMSVAFDSDPSDRSTTDPTTPRGCPVWLTSTRRRGSTSTWPTSMTLEENLRDLEAHARDFVERTGSPTRSSARTRTR